jgi:hypothetical protein
MCATKWAPIPPRFDVFQILLDGCEGSDIVSPFPDMLTVWKAIHGH